MIGKIKEAANAARLRAGQMLRERRERAEEKRAANVDPPGVTVSAELVRGVKFASWIAYIALMYFLWERVLDVSQAQHSTLEVTHFGIWSNLDLSIFFPLIVGYVFVVIGVPYVAKISIPTLVSLNWTEHFWPKLVSLCITVLVSVVLITGTATVGSNAIIESERGSAVAVEQVERDRAVLQSRIDAAERELSELRNHPNTYFAIAASMTPETYRRTNIEARRGDPQYDRFVSALGASEDAAALRQRISGLRDQLAAAPTTAAVASEVVTARTQTLNGVMDFLNTFWVLMLAVVMDLACLFMPWIAMRLEQKRNSQMGLYSDAIQSRWALIDDQSETTQANRNPHRRAAQDVAEAMIAGGADPRWAADMARSAASVDTRKAEVRDAETDELIIDRDGDLARKVREHTRKVKGKDGKPVKMVVPAAPPQPDETGFKSEGDERVASAGASGFAASDFALEAGPLPQTPDEASERVLDPEPETATDGAVVSEPPNHPEPSTPPEQELTPQERADLEAMELAADVEQPADEAVEPTPVVDSEPEAVAEQADDDDQEQPIDQDDTPAEREPETNPAKLIAAE